MDVTSLVTGEVDGATRRGRILPRTGAPEQLPPAIHDGPVWGELAHRGRVYRRGLAIADMIAAAATLLLAITVTGSSPRWMLFLVLPAIVFGGKVLGLYDRDELVVRKTTLDDAPRLFQLSMMTVLVVWLADSFMLAEPLRKPQALVLGAALPALTLLARRAVRSIARR